jgi:hypothetical protein
MGGLKIAEPIEKIEIPEIPEGMELPDLILEKPSIVGVSGAKGEGFFQDPSLEEQKMKITPDLSSNVGVKYHDLSAAKLGKNVSLGKVPVPSISRKRPSPVSIGVTAVFSLILGVVALETFSRYAALQALQGPRESPGNDLNLNTTFSHENNGMIDIHRIETDGMADLSGLKVPFQVETTYLDYIHKAILVVTSLQPLTSESFQSGNGQFTTVITISGVNQDQADLIHKLFAKEYQETGSARAAFDWLRGSPWGAAASF